MCDVAEERSQNELITDVPLSHGTKRHSFNLKIVTVGFFFSRFVFLIGLQGTLHWLFLETGIITRFSFFSSTTEPPHPPIPHVCFNFVIGSLFNLVKKIGLAWERRNSIGNRFCCFRVVRIVCAEQEEKVPVCAKTS